MFPTKWYILQTKRSQEILTGW